MKRPMLTFTAAALLSAALLTGCASGEAAQPQTAWPAHEPGATPFVRLMPSGDELLAQAEASMEEPEEYGSIQELLRSFYDEVGSFYIGAEEHQMFLELPQDEPFCFSVNVFPGYGSDPRMQKLSEELDSERDASEELMLERWHAMLELGNQLSGEYALRTAEEFAAHGCDCEVRVMRSVGSDADFDRYICIVTTTPEKLWELSGAMERFYTIEQLYDSVDKRFTETVWPEQ